MVETAAIKEQIREKIEEEEKINYEKRMKIEWVDAVGPMIKKIHAEYACLRCCPCAAKQSSPFRILTFAAPRILTPLFGCFNLVFQWRGFEAVSDGGSIPGDPDERIIQNWS